MFNFHVEWNVLFMLHWQCTLWQLVDVAGGGDSGGGVGDCDSDGKVRDCGVKVGDGGGKLGDGGGKVGDGIVES